MSRLSRRLRNAALVAALAFAAFHADARNADGTLGLTITPNNGVPTIVRPGGSFEATLTAQATLEIVSDSTSYALETVWSPGRGGRATAFCSMPADAAPGIYALEAKNETGTDRNTRAVFVVPDFSDYYVIAHLSDAHIGSNRHARPAEAIVSDLITAVNASDAHFVVLTGDLTDNGTPEEFQAFLRVIDQCRLPTFVTPGNHDRPDANYERYFGPLTYMFRFGNDGFMAFDTKDFVIADDMDAQDADLQVFRRAVKPCRYAVGLTHRYQPPMGMRAQIALFVDDPIDALFFGHTHRENTPEEAVLPWGGTRIVMTPAAVDGMLRYIDMTASGIRPRPSEKRAEIE